MIAFWADKGTFAYLQFTILGNFRKNRATFYLVLHLVTLSIFLQVSRTLRRELEHFDVVMKDEFEVAFGAYRSSYWRSLQVTAHRGVNVCKRHN